MENLVPRYVLANSLAPGTIPVVPKRVPVADFQWVLVSSPKFPIDCLLQRSSTLELAHNCFWARPKLLLKIWSNPKFNSVPKIYLLCLRDSQGGTRSASDSPLQAPLILLCFSFQVEELRIPDILAVSPAIRTFAWSYDYCSIKIIYKPRLQFFSLEMNLLVLRKSQQIGYPF